MSRANRSSASPVSRRPDRELLGENSEAIRIHSNRDEVDGNEVESRTPERDLEKHVQRGLEYLFKDDFSASIAEYTKAIDSQPNDVEALTGRGHAFGGLGDLASAIEDFSNVIDLEPKNADCLFHRGIAYQVLGREELSSKDIIEAITIDSRFVALVHVLDKYKKVHRDFTRDALLKELEAVRIKYESLLDSNVVRAEFARQASAGSEGVLEAGIMTREHKAPSLSLPDKAPELWQDRAKRKSENPEVFIERVYRPWLGSGLALKDLRRLDLALYKAFKVHRSRHGEPAFHLPDRTEVLDREIASHDPQAVRRMARLASAQSMRRHRALKP